MEMDFKWGKTMKLSVFIKSLKLKKVTKTIVLPTRPLFHI